MGRFAADLGDFLRAQQHVDATDGPPAGDHSGWRGAGLSVYDHDTRQAVEELQGFVDREAVLAVWDRATATSWTRPSAWVHGDVAASNLLTSDGRLSAVIDFGCSAIGDPACDLVAAWTMFDGDNRHAFRDHVRLDDDTWTRARGWALEGAPHPPRRAPCGYGESSRAALRMAHERGDSDQRIHRHQLIGTNRSAGRHAVR